MSVAAVLLLLITAGRAWAAIELAYFRATSTETSVLLEWATIREFNVSGFEILCKLESEPDTAFHPIGSRIATGGPDQSATYSFNVTALQHGVRYCFRLREVTADDTPGEQFDLCGYGLGLAPPALDVVGDVTPTPILLQVQPGVTPAPTLAAPGQMMPDMPTPTPAVPQDPFASPLGLPTPTPTPFDQQDQFTSPLTAPGGQLPDANAADIFLTPTVDPFASPTPTPQPPGSLIGGAPQIDPLALATETPTPTIVLPETATPIQESPLATGPSDTIPGDTIPETEGLDTGQPDIALAESPTPLYVVVTATPTPEAGVLPVFTPWPTPTPPSVFKAESLLAPTSQNLMVMLLCLIFLSASGLGILGLVTSVIYMRSQAARDRLPGPYYYDRRRY